MKEGIDEEEIDEEDTIVVDCSTLERLHDRPTAKSRGPRRKLTTYAHKRKVVIEDANEVPDSQDGRPAMEKRRRRSVSDDTSKVADKQEAKSAVESMHFHCQTSLIRC